MCTNPIIAYRIKENFRTYSHGYDLFTYSSDFLNTIYTSNGKRRLFGFHSFNQYKDNSFFIYNTPEGSANSSNSMYELVLLPCGKCDECMLKHADMWSIRNQHEALCHKDMCFLTLTYDEFHCPRNNGVKTVFYPDVQIFMKRLRSKLHYIFKRINKIDSLPKIRYFVCQEYGGSASKRPHFHVLLYGFCPSSAFDSKYLWKYGKTGCPVFRNNFFEKVWKKGMVFVGQVTAKSCGYVSRYTLDKLKHRHLKGFYESRFPEKISMSRREGIGIKYFMKNKVTICSNGYIRDFDNPKIKHSIPRGYYQYIERRFPRVYEKYVRSFRYDRFISYLEKCKSNIKCYDDIIKNFKHQIQHDKHLINNHLFRTLSDDDFESFDYKIPIIRC